MKHLLLTTIAAVLVVGCGPSAPDISIHDAAKAGDIETVKQHLAAGTDVNAKTDGRMSPLHKAAWGGHKETIELLIANGADVNAKDGEALIQEKGYTNFPGYRVYVDRVDGNDLHDVSIYQYDESQKLRMRMNAEEASLEVNADTQQIMLTLKTVDGFELNEGKERTFLYSKYGPMALGWKDSHRETPLDVATRNGRTEAADLLRKHGGKTGEELKAAGK